MDELEPQGRTNRRRLLALLPCVLGVGGAALSVPAVAKTEAVVKPWPADRPTPALSLDDIDGKRWSLDLLISRVVLLNFWATWCEPCRTEMPSLVRLAKRHRREGLVVLAVNYREDAPKIRQFFAGGSLRLPVLLDADGDACAAWTPRVFPTTVLLDRTGRPRVSVFGAFEWTGSAASALMAPMLRSPA